MSENLDLDELLFNLSSKPGSMTQLTLSKRIATLLNSSDLPSNLWIYNVIRMLLDLGHVESIGIGSSRKISIAPPTLIKLAKGVDDFTHVLSGARSRTTNEKLEEWGFETKEEDMNGITEKLGDNKINIAPPKRVLLKLPSDWTDDLETIFGPRLSMPTAHAILSLDSIGLDDWYNDLQWHNRERQFQIMPETLDYWGHSEVRWHTSKPMPNLQESGMLIKDRGGARGSRTQLFHKPDEIWKSCDLPNEFGATDYARYWILKEHKHVPLMYNSEKEILAVPKGAPLPPLISRAVCSCTGKISEELFHRLPERESKTFFLTYSGVTSEVARKVFELLGIPPERTLYRWVE